MREMLHIPPLRSCFLVEEIDFQPADLRKQVRVFFFFWDRDQGWAGGKISESKYLPTKYIEPKYPDGKIKILLEKEMRAAVFTTL